jgi:hypothetical protein
MPKNSDHDMNWRNLPEHDYFLFARSYHAAAKKLARMLDLNPGPIPQFDLCPVLSAYRNAIELHLKLIVLGDGGKFLATPPDELSVHKTRSLSWLAQVVTQIVTTLRWEGEFRTDGIESLADFKVVIEEANGIDPAFHAFRCPTDSERPEAVKSSVLEFVGRLDVLVDLLAQTADSLAAEWDLRSDATALDTDWPGGKPTIQ